MPAGKYSCSLRKYEIVKGKTTISRLFADGRRHKGGVLVMISSSTGIRGDEGDMMLPKVLFAVSKKNVPGAVTRNRIKRLMREAYRLEKYAFVHHAEDGVLYSHRNNIIAFLYRGRKNAIPGLQDFRTEVRQLLLAIAAGKRNRSQESGRKL